VVVDDVPAGATMVGVPARTVRGHGTGLAGAGGGNLPPEPSRAAG